MKDVDLMPFEYRQTKGPRRRERAINWVNLAVVVAIFAAFYGFKAAITPVYRVIIRALFSLVGL